MHPQYLFRLFGIKGLEVYAYGLCMAIGILACFAFLMFAMWYKKFNDKSSTAVLIIGVFGTGFGIFCAMLVQSILNYVADPSKPFELAGMTFMGGLIGGVVSFLAVWNIYVYVVGPRTKWKWLSSKDMNAGLCDALPFIPIGIAIAHAFGRFGCFWAGCCYGQVVEDQSWGLPCASVDNLLRVPTQLFEMSFLFLLAGLMALLYFKFKFKYNFGIYAIFYGVWRFVLEFFRDDARGGIQDAVLTPSQIFSIVMVILGIGYFFLQYYVLIKNMKHPELTAKAVPAEGTEEETPQVLAEENTVNDTEPVKETDTEEKGEI